VPLVAQPNSLVIFREVSHFPLLSLKKCETRASPANQRAVLLASNLFMRPLQLRRFHSAPFQSHKTASSRANFTTLRESFPANPLSLIPLTTPVPRLKVQFDRTADRRLKSKEIRTLPKRQCKDYLPPPWSNFFFLLYSVRRCQ